MLELQAWFQPLLWICGALGTIGGFYKIIFPCIRFFKMMAETPKKIQKTIETMESLEERLSTHLDRVETNLDSMTLKLDRFEQIQVHLLHDGIMDIYADAKRNGKVTESSYRRALELYGMNGSDEYINHIMEELNEIHRSGC